jgi:NhaP-type Na+/H+ or K+/H+ antiporter
MLRICLPIGSATMRLRAAAIWDWLIFLLNGLLFILVGLQLRPVWQELADHTAPLLIRDAVLVLMTVVLVRFVWVFASAYVSRWVIPGLAARDPNPGWRFLTVLAWAGLRGADTLAAALAIPYSTASGAPFPDRALIIFLAFAVILATLAGQGLSLPPLIRRLGLAGDDSAEEQEEALAWRAATAAAQARIDALAQQAAAPAEVLDELRRYYAHRAGLAARDAVGQQTAAEHVVHHDRLRRDLLAAERQAVRQLRDQDAIGDEVRQRLEHIFDQEESRAER